MGLFARRCPYCGVKISDNASKCWRCKEWLISKEEKEVLDKNVKKEEELKKQAEGCLAGIVLLILIIVGGYIAIDSIIHIMFDKTEKNSTPKNVIEQQGDIIEQNNEYTEEKNAVIDMREEHSSKTTQQSVQPMKQPVAPQPEPQQPQNQDVDDFMN